jgi:hypothetical protein
VSKVDAIAKEVTGIDDDITQIDPDAEPNVAILGYFGIALLHAALDLHRTTGRIENTSKLDQEAIAHGLEYGTPVFCHRRIEQLLAMLPEGTQSSLFICLHQAGVTDNIGR